MSRTGEFFIALAGNFFVAAVVGWLEGTKAFTISFGIGLALMAVAFIFFRKKKSEPQSATIATAHVENKPETHIENKPVFENRPVFENKPTIIVNTGAAPAAAPAPVPDRRPKLTFDRWDYTGETLDSWEHGMFFHNDGEAALNVYIQRFEIYPGTFVCCEATRRIPAFDEGYVPVWLEEHSREGYNSEAKWNLLPVMKELSEARHNDYAVPIIARYKDFDGHEYESSSELIYLSARNQLIVGQTRQRKFDLNIEVYEMLRQSRPSGCLVENVSAKFQISFQEAEQILKRLNANGMAYRSKIDAAGDFMYFYRGPDD